MRMAWFGLALLAGCASPKPRVEALVETEVTATLDPLTVTGQDWSMTFADPGRVRMPRSLQVGNVEMLGTGACPLEDLAGIALYPATIATASEPNTLSSATVLWSGPGVVRVRVAYQLGYQCAASQMLTGTSTFTFFPSGRINRKDIVTPSTDVVMQGESCSSCSGGSMVVNGFFFTSFYKFARPRFFTPAAAEITQPDATAPMEGCVDAYDRRLGMSYLPSSGAVGTRVDHDSWIFDWTRGGGNLQPDVKTVTSNLVVAATPLATARDCAGVLAEIDDLPLDVNGDIVTPGDDGIYEISSEDRSLELAPGSVELPHGFAVVLPVVLDDLRHIHVTRGDGTDEEDVRFSSQAIEDEKTLIWIDSPIHADHVVHIEYD
ncbi:MAG: hypothetical protein ABI175_29465 [Polyangiales bacterium]